MNASVSQLNGALMRIKSVCMFAQSRIRDRGRIQHTSRVRSLSSQYCYGGGVLNSETSPPAPNAITQQNPDRSAQVQIRQALRTALLWTNGRFLFLLPIQVSSL